MRLFLTGPSNAGKTTIISACFNACAGPLYGFRSYKHPKSGNGNATIKLSAAPNQKTARWLHK